MYDKKTTATLFGFGNTINAEGTALMGFADLWSIQLK